METKEEEILKLLEGDIKTLKDALKETITEIVKQGYSNFPILIAHTQEITIADKIIDKEMFNTSFYFSASTLEALVEKGVILPEKQTAFEQQMTAAGNAACILLLHPDSMKFVFSPL